MTFNPCGRGVQYMERTVTDWIRPFRDSPMLVKRRWFPVPELTPLLPFPTVFNSIHYTFQKWTKRGPGEVWGAPVSYPHTRTPSGLTYDHICGTAEDFEKGAVFDPDAHVEYDRQWIPTCCGRVPPAVDGGLQIGGEAGDIHDHGDPTEGGIEIGGAAGDDQEHVDPTDGGIEIGGEVGDDQEHVDPTDGGIEIGGEAGDHWPWRDPAEGGIEIGGEAGDTYTLPYEDPTEGGIEIGGEAGDTYVVPYNDATEGGIEIGGAGVGDAFDWYGVAPRDVTSGGLTSEADIVLPERQSGDELWVIIGHQGTGSNLANSGWTRRATATTLSPASRIEVYTRTSDGTDSTAPFTATFANGCVYVAVSITGTGSTYATAGGTTGTGTSISAGPVMTTGAPNFDGSFWLIAATAATPVSVTYSTDRLPLASATYTSGAWNGRLDTVWRGTNTTGGVSGGTGTAASSTGWCGQHLNVR